MANLRQQKLSTDKLVLLGKSAETNEELVNQANNNELLLHTAKPGSPFANIKAPEKELTKTEIYEAAIMCAKYSQDWRDNKKNVVIHIFSKKNTYKEKSMSAGTFGVKDYKEIIVKKEDILEFEKNQNKPL
jgi:predicted ribosome quality control (RQC) complex YloA/Tae2 family protein